jgi:carbonic anhydrase/acetyltransferase-like protein (isoleucine patch superfamily)
MLIKHRGAAPVMDSSVFIAPTAVVVGKVQIGSRSRVMYGAILDSEGSRIEIGECAIVCENAVLRATSVSNVEHPVIVGSHVFIAPHATLLGCEVEDCSYIATGATVLQGATIQSGAAVAVGALVHANTVIPPEFFVPPNAIAVGDPVRLYGSEEQEAVANAIKSIKFATTAFGIEAEWEDRVSRYRQATEVRSEEFEAHFGDVVLRDSDGAG